MIAFGADEPDLEKSEILIVNYGFHDSEKSWIALNNGNNDQEINCSCTMSDDENCKFCTTD